VRKRQCGFRARVSIIQFPGFSESNQVTDDNTLILEAFLLTVGSPLQFDKNRFWVHNIRVVGSACRSCQFTSSPDITARGRREATSIDTIANGFFERIGVGGPP
jgi:hypothetical protein